LNIRVAKITQPTGLEILFSKNYKEQMQGMQPGSDSVFAPDIDALTFDSFTRFYVTDTDVAVLFNEYDVGPGALGAIRVTVPRATLGI
jgi:predicted transcriptional regulator